MIKFSGIRASLRFGKQITTEAMGWSEEQLLSMTKDIKEITHGMIKFSGIRASLRFGKQITTGNCWQLPEGRVFYHKT
jgi:hypothetical protein